MAMTIQDDMWEACQMLPEKQRGPFLYAIVNYGLEAKEPEGKPPWLPVFVVIRDRIKMSAAASEKGRRMAAARWGKHDAQADAAGDSQAYAQADAYRMHEHDAENEIEIEGEIPPYSPPMPSSVQDAPFWLQCLAAFNDQLGTSYTTMPEKCRHMLDRCADGYTVEEVRKMLAYKHEEWKGTKWRNCLTPNFLFSPDHFEQCMHQAKDDNEEVADYAKYDA